MAGAFAEELWYESPDAILAVGRDGRLLHWNRAAELIFGFSQAEVLGQPIDTILASESLEDERRANDELAAQDMVVHEAVRRRKDGSLLHVSISSKTLRDADGKVRCVWSMMKDVTRLKVLRDAKLVEGRFRDLLESTPDAILIANVLGLIVLVNSRTERLFGYSRGELIGSPVEMLLPPQLRASQVAQRRSFFNPQGLHSTAAALELSCLRRDGTEFPVEINVNALYTEEGQMMVSSVRDITDRRRAEQKFRGLLESAPDAIVIASRNGRITLVNSQTERLFGYLRGELLGKSVEILVPHRFHERHPLHRAHYFEQPRARSMGEGLELYGRRKDGSEFPVEVSLSPIETDEGLLIASAIRDATERRRYEQALQEANRLKSVFLASMSHELRTPLNGIIGFSEFLVDEKVGTLTPKQREYLGDILNSGRHLLRLINDVLDLSKVEAGKMEIYPEAFPVADAIAEACAVLSPSAQKKRVRFYHEVGAEVRTVTLDRQKFIQVLYNLLSNGVKFNQDDGEVRISAEADGEHTLLLKVRDTGIGIQPANIQRLFVEFQQLDSSPSRRFGGTGLGLALTKKIVEFQGGRIEVASEPGLGTTFTVRLPLPGEAHEGTQAPILTA